MTKAGLHDGSSSCGSILFSAHPGRRVVKCGWVLLEGVLVNIRFLVLLLLVLLKMILGLILLMLLQMMAVKLVLLGLLMLELKLCLK